jgi:hypothetical protein
MVLIACTVATFVLRAHSPDDTKKSTVLARAKTVFGDPLDWDQHVFHAVRTYGIRLYFDKSNRLCAATVEPLRILKDEDSGYQLDQEPPLSQAELDTLLARISRIKPIGKYKSSDLGFGGATGASTSKNYEHAVLSSFLRFESPQPDGVATSIDIYYLLPWEGVVTSKGGPNGLFDSNVIFTDDGGRYLVAPEVASNIQVGKKNTFIGARFPDSLLEERVTRISYNSRRSGEMAC